MTEYFEKELALIKNPIIKEIAVEGIKLLPEYFFHVPASSTGKYHPNYALGDGGLYRHVRAAVHIASMLFTIYDFSSDEQDMIITALILHDGWKQGENSTGNSTHNHPLVASNVLLEKIERDFGSEKDEFLLMICSSITTHMGQWSTSKWDKTVLPTPQSKMQFFVHQCDYLASRRPLEYNFSIESSR